MFKSKNLIFTIKFLLAATFSIGVLLGLRLINAAMNEQNTLAQSTGFLFFMKGLEMTIFYAYSFALI